MKITEAAQEKAYSRVKAGESQAQVAADRSTVSLWLQLGLRKNVVVIPKMEKLLKPRPIPSRSRTRINELLLKIGKYEISTIPGIFTDDQPADSKPKEIDMAVTECPHCRVGWMRTYCTRPGERFIVRYRKCVTCFHTDKTIQKKIPAISTDLSHVQHQNQ